MVSLEVAGACASQLLPKNAALNRNMAASSRSRLVLEAEGSRGLDRRMNFYDTRRRTAAQSNQARIEISPHGLVVLKPSRHSDADREAEDGRKCGALER